MSTTPSAGRRIASQRSGPPSNGTGTDSQATASAATGNRFRIAAEDLAPLKARILLMLALTVTKDDNEIQRMFTEY